MFDLQDRSGKLFAVAQWNASKALLHREIVATGQKTEPVRRAEFEMASLTPEQRQTIIDTNKSIPYYASKPEFDDAPTLDDFLRIGRKAIEKETQKRRAEAEQLRESKRRGDAARECIGEILVLEKAGDLEAIRNYRGHKDRDVDDIGSRAWADVDRARSSAIRNLEKARREQDKIDWIEAHGSTHLNRACLQEGYNCQRLYVTERAAMEAPGFEVDFDDRAQWKDRSCPSAAALDLLDEARKLDVGDAKIVWLTEGTEQPDYEYDDEPFRAREAVVIQNYLDQYWLVREV